MLSDVLARPRTSPSDGKQRPTPNPRSIVAVVPKAKRKEISPVEKLEITMLEDREGSPNGVDLVHFAKGETYAFATAQGVDLAEVFLRERWAEMYEAPPETPPEDPASAETEGQGDAEQKQAPEPPQTKQEQPPPNKSQPPPARKKQRRRRSGR
jgi:hypothetical protein